MVDDIPDFDNDSDIYTRIRGSTVIRILSLTRPHWPWVAGFIILIALVAAMDSYFTFLDKRLIDEGILAFDTAAINRIALEYLILMGLNSLGIFGFIYLAGVLGHQVRYDIRKHLFDHLQHLSLSYYDRTAVGWIISRITSDVDRMAEFVTWGILDSAWGMFSVATALIFMMTIDWQLGLIVFLMVPALAFIAVQFRRRIILQFREVRRTNSRITGAFNENITGVRVSKALVREERNLKEFGDLTQTMYRASYKAAWLSALFLPTIQFISAVAISVIVIYSGLRVQTGSMSIGSIYAFVSYVTFMLWPIQEMARVYAEMQLAIASGERVFSLMDTQPEIVDRPGAMDPGTLRGEIVFEDVDFYYTPEQPVLTSFNLTVPQGQTVALVGATGAGKSTIVNLLCRFYEPKRGRITIGGIDYTNMTLHGIHSRIGMVLQTPHLFSGTIRENIRYGKLSATDQEVEQAARMAGAHGFITALEKGYDEEVGEGGVLLSVGQKQLLSLARAILADPEVFIMDEATSSVDTLTEASIQQAMEQLTFGRTSFIIAHRLSTIKRADRILVLEHGRVIEDGNHSELIRQQGHYYNLYTKQFRNERQQPYPAYLSATSPAK